MNETTEIAKWAWHVATTDVIVRDPKTGTTGAWPVTSVTKCIDGCTVVTCDLEDGGERVLVYQPTQQADVRAHAVYSAPALLTRDEREQAIPAMTYKQRTYLAAEVARRYPEIFDAAYTQLQKAIAADVACLRDEVAS
jgi:hypothetical protein